MFYGMKQRRGIYQNWLISVWSRHRRNNSSRFIWYRRVRETSWASCDWPLACSRDVMTSLPTSWRHVLCRWSPRPPTWTSGVRRWLTNSVACCRHNPNKTTSTRMLYWTTIPRRRQDYRHISISGVCDSVTLKHCYALHYLLRKL